MAFHVMSTCILFMLVLIFIILGHRIHSVAVGLNETGKLAYKQAGKMTSFCWVLCIIANYCNIVVYKYSIKVNYGHYLYIIGYILV